MQQLEISTSNAGPSSYVWRGGRNSVAVILRFLGNRELGEQADSISCRIKMLTRDSGWPGSHFLEGQKAKVMTTRDLLKPPSTFLQNQRCESDVLAS